MAIYTLTRLFFYWTSRDLFPDVTGVHLWEMVRGGWRFDLTAILYLSSAYLLLVLLPLPMRWRHTRGFRITAKCLYLIPNLLGIIVNCIDIVYVRFTDRRTTITFFNEFQNDDNLLRIFLQGATQYWYVTIFALLMMTVLVLLYADSRGQDEPVRSGWLYYIRETIVMVVTVYLVVIGIRGGFGRYTRPITLSNALQYTNRPRETLLVLNTPFCLMRSTEGSTYTDPHYFEADEMAAIMTPEHDKVRELVNERVSERPLNVVVLILESFASEHIGFYNCGAADYEGYTPFLDSLLAQSVTWQHSFASGRKSIDAMPSVLSSIPMLIEPYVVTPYSTNAVSSIADCLNREGYTTAFFHGAPNGSMGFQAYARSAGFQAYYGMDEYPDAKRDFDGTWAIWDEEFLQYYAQTMSSMPEPFMTAVFTASSHHPFKVPARYEGTFPKGTQPLHQCIGYSDHALRQFFAYAETQPWFEHTLFVITADHTNQLARAEYTNALGLYRVPVAFYCPKRLKGEQREGVVSQTDIMPSVLEYIGYDNPYFAFGEDALTQKKTHNYAVCYNNPVFQIMNDSLLVQFDGTEVTTVYNYIADPTLQHSLPSEQAPEEMMRYLKAYIQQYTTRMIDNRLTYGSTDR